MASKSKYYLVESGEIRSHCEAYITAYLQARAGIEKYVLSLGADNYLIGINNRLAAVRFANTAAPDGFKKRPRNGYHYPKVKSPYYDEFQKQAVPSPVDWMKEYLGCPVSLKYSDDGGTFKGSLPIGNWREPIGIYWQAKDDEILLTIPDVTHYIEEVRRINKNFSITFEDNADQWQMNKPGCREIIKEEWHLIAAQQKHPSTTSQRAYQLTEQ